MQASGVTSCVQVNVSGNNLVELPSGFSAASSLLTLDASANQLAAMPEVLFRQMTNVTSLNLSCNLIGGLPEDIIRLSRCAFHICSEL
jgi:Leucine-rich repeat (LRR) protein